MIDDATWASPITIAARVEVHPRTIYRWLALYPEIVWRYLPGGREIRIHVESFMRWFDNRKPVAKQPPKPVKVKVVSKAGRLPESEKRRLSAYLGA